jgi:hypothetical protein
MHVPSSYRVKLYSLVRNKMCRLLALTLQLSKKKMFSVYLRDV